MLGSKLLVLKGEYVEKSNIRVNTKNCAQCLSCQSICSFHYTKSFNPLKARIEITHGHFRDGSWISNEIRFTDECKENCILCAKYCSYDALVIEEK